MSADDMLELVQLAEKLCPVILMDLHLMTEADLDGALQFLRNKAKESGQ